MNIQLDYQLGPEDLSEFRKNQRRMSKVLQPAPKPKKSNLVVRIAVPVITFAVVYAILAFGITPSARPIAGSATGTDWGGYLATAAVSAFATACALVGLVTIYSRRQTGISQCRKWIEKNPRFSDARHAEITEDQITIKLTHATVILEWPYFIRMFETDMAFLLYADPQSGHVLPKRAFSQPTDIVALRSILQARIGNLPTGFPVQAVRPIAIPPVLPPA